MAHPYGPRIRAARAFANLSQEELARRLEIDTQTIKRRESGSQAPKRSERMAIAAICGVPDWFLEEGWRDVQPTEIAERLEALEQLVREHDERAKKAVRDIERLSAPEELREAIRRTARALGGPEPADESTEEALPTQADQGTGR